MIINSICDEDKPPPQKRKRSRKDSIAVEPSVEPTPDQDIIPAVIEVKSIVKKAEQKQDSIPLFNIFNFNQKQKQINDSQHKLEHKKGGKKSKATRKKRENPPKIKSLLITDHFKPKFSASSEIPNDPQAKLDQDPLDQFSC